ncbi:MAG TPA: DUF309 domain-containing protein [Planctomycetota bacterium]
MSGSARADYPEEYLEGIRLFNAGEWYEAHEVWEERWQHVGDSTAEFYKALIQFAVAALHWERGNAHGARKLYRTARRYLEPYSPAFLGLDVDDFLARAAAWFEPMLQAIAAKRPLPAPDRGRLPAIRLADR